LAELEAEAFVKVGAWKNFDELEESISLVELNGIINAIRKDMKDTRYFLAALQGVDLDKYSENSVEEKRKEIERRAMEKLVGYEKMEQQEFAGFGLTFETIE
jgi:hypothetical protein